MKRLKIERSGKSTALKFTTVMAAATAMEAAVKTQQVWKWAQGSSMYTDFAAAREPLIAVQESNFFVKMQTQDLKSLKAEMSESAFGNEMETLSKSVDPLLTTLEKSLKRILAIQEYLSFSLYMFWLLNYKHKHTQTDWLYHACSLHNLVGFLNLIADLVRLAGNLIAILVVLYVNGEYAYVYIYFFTRHCLVLIDRAVKVLQIISLIWLLQSLSQTRGQCTTITCRLKLTASMCQHVSRLMSYCCQSFKPVHLNQRLLL